MTKLQLSVAMGDYDRTRALYDGRVQIDGVDPVFMLLNPEEMFFRAMRSQDFDIAELSFSSYLVKHSRGESPYIAVPVFLSRAFRHTSIYVRRDRIKTPENLKGCRIGVPEYQLTAIVWARALLEDEYGIKPSDVSWVRGGIDTLALPLARGAYTLDLQLSESLVLAKDGSGQLRMDSMERLSFADSKLALDNSFNGHGGITAMTLGAVFGARAVREHPDYVGIGLGLLDQGMTPLALMQLALDARLGAKASPQAVVDLLYFNVLGAHPSDAESAPYVALLNDGSFTPASLALMASGTSYNIDNIHLMGPGGLQETGLTYWG